MGYSGSEWAVYHPPHGASQMPTYGQQREGERHRIRMSKKYKQVRHCVYDDPMLFFQ